MPTDCRCPAPCVYHPAPTMTDDREAQVAELREAPRTAAGRALVNWFVGAARLTRDGKHGRELQRRLAEVEAEAAHPDLASKVAAYACPDEPPTEATAHLYCPGCRSYFASKVAAALDTTEPSGERDGLRAVVLAALDSEDEIAHGEAYEPSRGGLGVCAYCGDDWPCRTQRGIDRLRAALATPGTEPRLEPAAIPGPALDVAARAVIKGVGCVRMHFGARKPCDDPIYSGERELCSVCALRAALGAAPEAGSR